MKLADRIIDLMAPFPGRPFRMQELVNYANPRAVDKRSKETVRKQVQRVLLELEESGNIQVSKPTAQGGFSLYTWGRYAARKSTSDVVGQSQSCD